MRNWRYLLSKAIPVLMRSKYGLVEDDGTVTHWRTRWVQWRDRYWMQRTWPA